MTACKSWDPTWNIGIRSICSRFRLVGKAGSKKDPNGMVVSSQKAGDLLGPLSFSAGPPDCAGHHRVELRLPQGVVGRLHKEVRGDGGPHIAGDHQAQVLAIDPGRTRREWGKTVVTVALRPAKCCGCAYYITHTYLHNILYYSIPCCISIYIYICVWVYIYIYNNLK